jgi:hypothetical protein
LPVDLVVVVLLEGTGSHGSRVGVIARLGHGGSGWPPGGYLVAKQSLVFHSVTQPPCSPT